MKFLFIFLLSSFFSISNIYSQAILSDYSGEVKYRKNSFSDWESITSKDFLLPDGSALKTENNAKAKVLVGKSVIWMRPNSALEIETTSKYYTSLGLVYGKIKASVIGVVKRSRFQIRTVSSVFGVRGTDIMIIATIDGSSFIDVLFGEVEFEYIIPPKKGERRFLITQGMSFGIKDVEKPYEFGLISREKESEIMSNWDPSISDSNSYDGIFKREDRKERLRNFITYSNGVNYEVGRFIHKEKESDFESGRTLKDIHGNTVRVDQRLIRPDDRTLELLNLVKRENYSNYNYSTSYSNSKPGFKYNGGENKNRLDAFIITFNFNKDIPKDINKWQSFFGDSSVNPNWATFVNANVSNDNVFFIAEAYKYINSRGELVNNTEVVGVNQNTNERNNDILITGIISKGDLNDITKYNFKEENVDNPTGNIVKKTDLSVINGAIWGLKVDSFEIKGEDVIYQLKGNKYVKGGNTASGNNGDYFWLTQENYLISNSGNVRSKKDIFSSNKSVSELVNQNAIESMVYIKKNVLNSKTPSDEDYFSINNNIDTVLIGDVPFMILEKIYSGVDKWKD